MKKVPKIGIMQGRLSKPIGNQIQSFPKYTWRYEFEKASKCGFEFIEWVFDLYENNPIFDNETIKEIGFLSEKHRVKINAVCGDFFMEKKLFHVSEFELKKNVSVLKNLIKRCHDLDIKILEIPLVDSSSLRNDNDKEQLTQGLHGVLPLAEENNVQITLETDLPPSSFKELLTKFNHPNIKANYDTGNSVALGYNTQEELVKLEPWLANIHIKDRVYQADTVPLGDGNTNFDLFFETLSRIKYEGDLIIQGARELDNTKIEPEETCVRYFEFVNEYVDKYFR